MDLGLKGKKAIVTGATRGIGRAIVDRLAEEGVDIALCARNAEEVDSTISALTAKGVKAIGNVVDVSDGDSYRKWVEESAKELGGLDIFVPNVSAGGGSDGEESWRANFEIDMMGTVRGCEAALPFLKDSGHGAIVMIGTTAAIENFIAPQPYNALKAAIINYAKHLGQQVAVDGIRVNTVSPGPIYFEGGAWDQIKSGMPEVYEGVLAQIPMGRMGHPKEVANSVVFLASPAAAFVTGTNLIVDGGITKGVQF